MARTPIFYFGTVIFFVGLLLLAAGIAAVIGEAFTVITIVELISGFILLAIGYRATNRPKQPEST
jgi:threonine/homoserine/homoserine lactone efflux protein